MQSYSRSHYYPALGDRVPDRLLTANVDSADQLPPEATRVWSFQEPALLPGDYALTVSQTVQLPASTGGQVPPPENLSIPDKLLHVLGPKFSLNDPADLHSVHPAAGHSAPARTLAHVVLGHPTVPWERDVSTSGGQAVGFNRLPWLGVLSFTEDELLLSDAPFEKLGFDLKDGDQPSGLGAISTVAKRLDALKAKIASTLTLTPPGPDRDFADDDKVSMLLLEPGLFKDMFSIYDANNKRKWNEHADLSRFAMLAHALETHGGFMASTYANKTPSPQPKFSVVMSARTGPSNISAPTRIISHLISLDGLEKLDISNPATEYVGLVSLQAWDWMAMPEESVDFAAVMSSLGQTVKPLAADYDDKLMAPRDGEQAPPDEAISWIKAKFEAGFVLKRHTTMSGEQTQSLLRGPMVPLRSSTKVDGVKPFSLYGEGLEYVDKDTGIPVMSYKAAWALGRSMVMADRALTSSFLRLRGRVHAEAVRRVKSKSLMKGGNKMFVNNPQDLLGSLENVVDQLEKNHTTKGLWDLRSGANRWTRSNDEAASLPARLLSSDSTSYTLTEYLDEVHLVMLQFFGFESKDEAYQPTPARPIDADAAAIRAWALDRLMLAGIPLHSLILEPSMLPRESIRTFFVDNCWIDFLVDGGLSVANHYARDDDALRRAIKECINKYLDTPVADGPSTGIKPQLPRWGFFMRSVAVSGCPDLKVEAPLPPGSPANLKEVLYMQKLAPDVLVCLFDRCPGDGTLTKVIIAQPHHQQGYELGGRLEAEKVEVYYRVVPKAIGQPAPDPKIVPFFAKDGTAVYDFKTRTIRPDAYMTKYFASMQGSQGFEWPDQSKPPSSLLATQLWSTNLRLELTVKGDQQKGVGDDASKPLRFSTGCRPDQKPGVIKTTQPPNTPTTPSRAPPSKVSLPTGPRRQILQVNSPSVFSAEQATSKSAETIIEKLQQDVLPHQQLPAQANCKLIYEPGNNTNSLYATSSPNDLVFQLSADASSGIPREVEVRIPIALSSNVYPPGVKNGSSQGFLMLEGTANTAHVPVIEDTSVDRYWKMTGRIAQGSLYDINTASPPSAGLPVPPQADPIVMLAISIKPRFSSLPSLIKAFNVSLLLRKVNLNLPPENAPSTTRQQLPSRAVRFDVLWHQSQTATSVRTTDVVIRPAVVATIASVKSVIGQGDIERLTMRFALSCLPPPGAQVRVKVIGLGYGDDIPLNERIYKPSLPETPVDNPFVFECTQDLRTQGPVRITATVTDNAWMTAFGPESAEYFPLKRVYKPNLNVILCWKDNKMHLFWAPTRQDQVPFNVTPQTTRPKRIEYATVPGTQGYCELPDLAGPQSAATATEMHFIATFQSDKSPGRCIPYPDYIHVSLPPTPPPLPFTTRRSVPGTPFAANSQLSSMTYLRGQVNAAWDSELWYCSGSRNFTGVRVRRDEGQLIEGGDQNGPAISANFADCAGALVPFYVGSRPDSSNYFMIAWVGSDGSVSVSFRQNRQVYFLDDKPEDWTTLNIAPAGSASVAGGGSIDASALGEVDDGDRKPPSEAVLWWVGPRGELYGRRCRVGNGQQPEWVPLKNNSTTGDMIKPAGSLRMPPSPSPPSKLAQIAAAFGPPRTWLVFWISSAGDLMFTQSKTDGSVRENMVARRVRAGPSTALVARYHVVRNGKMGMSVAWVSEDGAVYNVYTAGNPWDDIQGPEKWIQVSASLSGTGYGLTTPGAAHPATDLCIIGGPADASLGVVFVGVDGSLNVVTRRWVDEWQMDSSSWSVLATKGPQKGARLRLAVAGPALGRGVTDVFFWIDDNKLGQLGVDLSATGYEPSKEAYSSPRFR